MPILKDTRQTKTVSLLTIEGGEVEVYQSLLAGDIDRIYKENGPAGDMSILLMLSTLIKSWNLTNEAGEVLPITRDNVALFDARDINLLVAETELGKEFAEKKALAPSDSNA